MSNLFQVTNHHIPQSGEPPSFDGDDGNYYSYFVNQYGEQWVFQYNRKTKTLQLRGGDVGWKTVIGLPGLRSHLFGNDERTWLAACFHASGAGQLAQYLPTLVEQMREAAAQYEKLEEVKRKNVTEG